MKGLLQRFTQWFNRKHGRSGGLWEDAYKSVLVEDGVASLTMAAYIDLNQVRADMRPSRIAVAFRVGSGAWPTVAASLVVAGALVALRR